MVQVKVADPEAPVLSVTVTVTVEAPAVVGVPVISPVEEPKPNRANPTCADRQTQPPSPTVNHTGAPDPPI